MIERAKMWWTERQNERKLHEKIAFHQKRITLLFLEQLSIGNIPQQFNAYGVPVQVEGDLKALDKFLSSSREARLSCDIGTMSNISTILYLPANRQQGELFYLTTTYEPISHSGLIHVQDAGPFSGGL